MSAWRDRLLPASFRGAQFHVETGGRQGGRRIARHEFPKKDKPYSEDMGRRARVMRIAGYVIGPDYTFERDDLISALERSGPGMLVHPTQGQMLVVVDDFFCSESRQRGGMAEFDMSFIEAGQAPSNASAAATQEQSQQGATAAEEGAAAATDSMIANPPASVSV